MNADRARSLLPTKQKRLDDVLRYIRNNTQWGNRSIAISPDEEDLVDDLRDLGYEVKYLSWPWERLASQWSIFNRYEVRW